MNNSTSDISNHICGFDVGSRIFFKKKKVRCSVLPSIRLTLNIRGFDVGSRIFFKKKVSVRYCTI
jgi:hypothetical protein